jgi:hypothetical protein
VRIWPLAEPPFAIIAATIELETHADSTLGGGALACTTTARSNLGAGAPLGAAAAIVRAWLNHATAAGLSRTDFTAEGEQNRIL